MYKDISALFVCNKKTRWNAVKMGRGYRKFQEMNLATGVMELGSLSSARKLKPNFPTNRLLEKIGNRWWLSESLHCTWSKCNWFTVTEKSTRRFIQGKLINLQVMDKHPSLKNSGFSDKHQYHMVGSSTLPIAVQGKTEPGPTTLNRRL